MLVFPSNPNTGDVFGQWQWDGEKWTRGGWSAAFTLEGLTDVAISDPTQGEMLTWDATAEKWANMPVPEVDLAAYATQQFVHDQIAAIPAPPTPSLMGLSDTSLANLAAGQALTYSGAAWVNSNTFVGPVVVDPPVTVPPGGMYSLQVTAATDAGSAAVAVFGGALGSGLFVQGGSNAAQTAILVRNSSAYDSFKVLNDGSGQLGVSRRMTWDTAGNWAIGRADNLPTRLDVGMSGPSSMTVPASTFASVINLAGSWIGCAPTSAGSQGLSLYAASNNYYDGSNYRYQTSQGACLYVQNNGSGIGHQFYCASSGSSGAVIGSWLEHLRIGYAGNIHMFNLAQGGANYPLHVNNGHIYWVPSSRRYKDNIRTVAREQAREIVRKLRATTYTSLCKADDPKQEFYGLVAEEVAEVDPRMVCFDKDGTPGGVKYDSVTMLLLTIVQELLEEQTC